MHRFADWVIAVGKSANLGNVLHFAYYSFCRVHQTLRVTAATEAGIADHVLTIKELVGLLEQPVTA